MSYLNIDEMHGCTAPTLVERPLARDIFVRMVETPADLVFVDRTWSVQTEATQAAPPPAKRQLICTMQEVAAGEAQPGGEKQAAGFSLSRRLIPSLG